MGEWESEKVRKWIFGFYSLPHFLTDSPAYRLTFHVSRFTVHISLILFLLFSRFCILAHGQGDNANPTENLANDLQLPAISLLQKTETVQFKDLSRPFALKHWPILRDSEGVTINGKRLTKNLDYQIEYHAGTINFLKDFPPDATVRIAYQALPFAIKKQYKRDLFQQGPQLVDEPASAEELEARPERPTPGAMEMAPSPLQVTGTQTFGVSVGSGRSLSQNQELRISVDGEVSENVSVIALLSDQDLPIQPEGTTEDIQDIDQKLIRITSPNVTATLGDFEGSLGSSEFIFFPRALEGVQVEGNFKWGSFSLIPSSIPKGQSASKTVRGEEGRSEYRIDVDGEFVVLKAGSEIVWLNGERMRRGENNDYVIRDYGDPIIEFTSKHLITSNDVIRVDFEFIPEDLAYQRNLQGVSGLLNLLLDGRAAIGLAYAVESDLKDPENAFIILSEEEIKDLQKNELDADDDGIPLIAPKRRTVWGVEGRLDLNDQTSVEGQIAFSALDENTLSNIDSKVLGRAWKLLANSSSEKLLLNLDFRSLDADFVPVGASSTNRTRFRYEEQYTEERFDDLYLLGAAVPSRAPDEKSLDFDLQFKPFSWLRLDSGLGRTEERFEESADGQIMFHNSVPRVPIKDRDLPASIGVSRFTPYAPGNTQYATRNTEDDITIRNNFNWGFDFRPPKFPRLKNNTRRSTSKVRGQDQFRKERGHWVLSHRIRPFTLNASTEQLESIDLDASDGVNLNRKRNISTGRMNLADFQWASINTEYSVEEAFDKEDLLTVDGETLGFSDWKLMTTARTWTIGLFSQPRKWTNFSTNLSRRVFKVQRGLEADSTTQLADINLRLTPFNRALDGDMTYELDKKLATERREIYTDFHPITGNPIPPGEGHYVRIDEHRYKEDFENGTYIKIIQNVDDKPVSAIDVKFRLRFQPRRIISRRRRIRNLGRGIDTRTLSLSEAKGNSTGEAISSGHPANGRTDSPRALTATRPSPSLRESGMEESRNPQSTIRDRIVWLANAIRGEILVRITEEQEDPDPTSLYLLRNFQNEQTIFGRKIQRYRLDFSPSSLFNLDLGFNTNRILNKRINNRERRRHSRDWDIGLTLNPTAKLSLGVRWEQRREREEFTQLDPEGKAAELISDLSQFERTNAIDFRYELSRAMRLGLIGGYEITSDLERLDEEPEAETQTLSIENQLTYAFIRKGRLDFTYRIGYGNSKDGIPFARYNFYEGISHEVRITADYTVRKVTDLLLRFNYRLLSTKQRKPEHRMGMEVVAQL